MLTSGNDPLQVSFQLDLGPGAEDLVDLLASLEYHQRGEAADALTIGDVEVLLCVNLDELDLAAILLGELLNHRRENLSWAAPGGLEVYHDGKVSLQHFLLELLPKPENKGLWA